MKPPPGKGNCREKHSNNHRCLFSAGASECGLPGRCGRLLLPPRVRPPGRTEGRTGRGRPPPRGPAVSAWLREGRGAAAAPVAKPHPPSEPRAAAWPASGACEAQGSHIRICQRLDKLSHFCRDLRLYERKSKSLPHGSRREPGFIPTCLFAGGSAASAGLGLSRGCAPQCGQEPRAPLPSPSASVELSPVGHRWVGAPC